MDFASYTGNHVHHAVHLVNHLTPGCRSGRPMPVPATESARKALVLRVFEDADFYPGQCGTAEVAPFFRLAAGLRTVFELAGRGDVDGAADRVNQLLEEYSPRPQLSQHDGQPWHMHFHRDDEGPSGWGAGCATALAIVIGDGDAGRLGICTASQCDRVYVDTSRNVCRRFCSEACTNRTKVSAFRARRALARLTGLGNAGVGQEV
jgi:hypothetical protein